MNKRVVIVTGGTSGIGKACAKVFGEAGASIVITGRNQELLDDTFREFFHAGIKVLALKADASVEADNQYMIDETLKHFGRIDVLINNAGISMRAIFEELNLDVIRKVMDINFYGAVYATKYALPHLIESKGTVVGISSIAGYRGLPGRTAYSASKFALNGFLEALRTELLHQKVNVLTVAPGFTASNIRQTALTKDGSSQAESPRDESAMMSADECAKHIFQAVLKRKKLLVLTQQGKLTVLMNKLFPVWMDKKVFDTMHKEPDSPLKTR
ncbi:MAG: SDR family oxidoreductase [Cytophagales bacterium]|nr:MAG: SDR family oxidoreductase [Cytophagales bacterium]TAF60058.1 MAG: SDR family oxidoreductase [Cytophagales bacterium]